MLSVPKKLFLLVVLNSMVLGYFAADPSTCDCGWRQQVQTRIIGGDTTETNEYAFMAGLESTSNGQIFCGASIISKRYAITSAKCCKDRPAGEVVLVVGNAGDPKSTKRYTIKEFIVHDNNAGFNKNNIALLRTAQDIKFSMAVGPICLPASYTNKNFTGVTVTAMGWGLITSTSKTESLSLQEVDLVVVNQSTCQQQYLGNSSMYMCTYAKDKGPCRKDAGGPLVWFDTINNYRNYLVGVISNGTCASKKPDISMRVTKYLPWIQDKTSDVPACYK